VVKAPAEARVPERDLRVQLAARGFQEVVGWSFVAREQLETLSMGEGAQPLANPLSAEMAVLRTSLLPGLLDIARRNLRRQLPAFRLFEIGHRFIDRGERFEESWRLGLLMTGSVRPEHFATRTRPTDFFDLKGEIEQLLRFNAVEGGACFTRSDRPWLHPGQSAELLIGERSAGWLGQLHPEVAERLDLQQAVFVAELDGETISQRAVPEHSDSGRFPSVRRDIAVVVADDHTAGDILQRIETIVGSRLEACFVFDEYRGSGIESGFRSLAIGLILRDVSRTLEDREVDALIESVLTDLEQRFHARLRG
jgi:phenylalanyl-tRNA synthetase beta chain